MNISTTKIEHRALNALESIIDEHPTMEYSFNSEDKEMAWDGYILLFKDIKGSLNKADFDSRIPVQIKGHIDPERVYINKQRITYPVDVQDLYVYSSERGVLYFQIFLNNNKQEVFYTSLYPSKIADYLETIKKKGNKKKYSIPFTKLEKDSVKLYYIVKQFAEESKKQGTAYNPLVADRIRCNEFCNLKSISLTAVGVKNRYDALLRLSSGDICLYGKMEGDKYPRPLEWLDDSKFFIGQEVSQNISIGDDVFYDKYSCITDSDGRILLKLSPNLDMDLTNGIVSFKINSTIKVLGNDARFILKLLDTEAFCINGKPIVYTDMKPQKEFVTRLEYIVDLCKTLEMIDFDMNTMLTDYTEGEKAQFTKLVNFRLGAYNSKISDGYSRFDFKFGDKYIPLLVVKKDNEIELANALYSTKYGIYLPDNDDDNQYYIMPLFVYQEVDVLCNLYKYDFALFYEQIDKSDINEKTAYAFLEAASKIECVYDRVFDERFLDIAIYIMDRIKPYLKGEVYLLSSLQILKRKRRLGKDEIKVLEKIESKDYYVMFEKYVLLEDRKNADIVFDKFSVKEKEECLEYPIYRLYQEI